MTSRSWVPVLVWFLLVGIGCWVALNTTRIQTQLSLLLPSGGSPTQRLLVNHLRWDSTSRLLLIALTGSAQPTLAEASKRLATMMQDSSHFAYVQNGETIKNLKEFDLLYTYRYLLSQSIHPNLFSISELREALQSRLQDLAFPLPPFMKNRIPNDPTNEFPKILQTWDGATSPKRYQDVWFSTDGRYAILAAKTTAPGFDLDAQEQIQQNLKKSASHMIRELTPNDPIKMVSTGPAVFAVESRAKIKEEAKLLSILATLLVTIFLFANYRSLTLIGLSIVPLGSGLLAAVIAVNFAFGFIHGITLAFGTTLIGVAIDYPIHVFSHWSPGSSPSVVLGRIWPIIRLGVVTTALGYCAMLFSGFPGLSQLGLFAIVGLLTAALVTRWILPINIPREFDAKPLWGERLGKIGIGHHSSLFLGLVIVGLSTYLALSDKPFWEMDIANLSPIPQEIKDLDSHLRKEIGAPTVRDVMILTARTEQEILEQSEEIKPILDRLIHQGTITGYDIAARYLPSIKTQYARQAALPETKILQARLEHAQEGLPFKSGTFWPFIKDIETARHLQPLRSQNFQNLTLGEKIHSLLFNRNGLWIGVVPFEGVTDRTQLASLANEHKDSNLQYLDLKLESNQMVTTYRQEILKYLSMGSLAIIVVLIMGLRSLSNVLRVVMPVGAAILTASAVLHLFDERLSLFHLASLLLIIGIGIDYALFFNRKHESTVERSRTCASIFVCSVTTMLVFGLLALSEIPVLHSIGITVSLGTIFCLLYSAMLAKPEFRLS